MRFVYEMKSEERENKWKKKTDEYKKALATSRRNVDLMGFWRDEKNITCWFLCFGLEYRHRGGKVGDGWLAKNDQPTHMRTLRRWFWILSLADASTLEKLLLEYQTILLY